MSEATQESFLCDGCGRKFALTPAIAGKKVRCKCGQILDVPAAHVVKPAPAPSVESDDPNDLYGLAEDLDQPVAPIKPITPIAIPATGVNVATASNPKKKSAPAAGGAIAGFATTAHSRVKYDDSSENRRGLIIGAACLLLIGVLIGAFALLKKSEPVVAKKGADAEIIKMMDDQGTLEAKEFIESHKSKMIMGMTRESSLQYIDRLYARGATKVLAFNGTMTRSLILVLPPEAEKRKELFEYVNLWHEDMGLPSQNDDGQEYLRLMMKL